MAMLLGQWTSSLILQLNVLTLLSQQFAAVQAADYIRSSIDRISTTKIDLVGLISALSTESAKKSFTFSSLNEAFSITGHVGPGSLSLATAFLQMTGFRLAELLTLGDSAALPHLECPPGFRYLGIYSRTKCPVLNTVGASVISEFKDLWNLPSEKPLEGTSSRDAGRSVEVIVLSTGRMRSDRAQLKGSLVDGLLLGWLPLLLTAGFISLACITEEWFAAALLTLGTLGMSVAVLALQSVLVFRFAKPNVAQGAPEMGDCLIYNGNTFHIVEGTEEVIQALFQRKLEQETNLVGRFALLLSGLMLYAYSIASIIWLPNVSVYGQMFFTGANLLGLIFDMIKGSKNGRLGLARKAKVQFEIKLKKRVVFGNRTAAVAFVARHMDDCDLIKSEGLLPIDGPVWEKWWEVFPKAGHVGFEKEVESVKFTAPGDEKLFRTLIGDMKTGISYSEEEAV